MRRVEISLYLTIRALVLVISTCRLVILACNLKILTSYEPANEIWVLIAYSKTCLKWPLKKRQNKDLNDKW